MTSVQLGEALWDMEDYRPLVLSVAPEESPALPASMPVMMIYAGTRQPERCLEFLAFCAENLDAAAWVALSPQRGEPVKKAGLEEELAALEAQLSALAAQPEVEALQLEREELQLRLQAPAGRSMAGQPPSHWPAIRPLRPTWYFTSSAGGMIPPTRRFFSCGNGCASIKSARSNL